jgi:flagellar hook protein FlgE
MNSAMNTGVSGLQAHQAMLDVISNNIANVNTTGYKAENVEFADVLSETVTGAVAPSTSQGGINAMQKGLGVTVGSITRSLTQGGLQVTGKGSDLAIQGSGYFVLSTGSNRVYTRAGAFNVDASGYLVDSVTGYRVQGSSGDIVINGGTTTSPQKTAKANFTGNLDTTAAAGQAFAVQAQVFDSLGSAHTLTLTFTKQAADAAANPPVLEGTFAYATTAAGATVTGGSGTLVFQSDGTIASGGTGSATIDFPNGANPGQAIAFTFGAGSGTTAVTGLAAPNTMTLGSQDGYGPGTIQSYSIGADGTISASANGRNRTLGTLLIATFNNPSGLLKTGENLFTDSVNSGLANLGTPGTGGRGTLAPGTLEGSNVDLAAEFTHLITAQRGFQANARVITTTDQLMEETVNLKR